MLLKTENWQNLCQPDSTQNVWTSYGSVFLQKCAHMWKKFDIKSEQGPVKNPVSTMQTCTHVLE